MGFLDEVAEEMGLGVIEHLDASFRHNAAIVCLDRLFRKPLACILRIPSRRKSTYPHHQVSLLLSLGADSRHSIFLVGRHNQCLQSRSDRKRNRTLYSVKSLWAQKLRRESRCGPSVASRLARLINARRRPEELRFSDPPDPPTTDIPLAIL